MDPCRKTYPGEHQNYGGCGDDVVYGILLIDLNSIKNQISISILPQWNARYDNPRREFF